MDTQALADMNMSIRCMSAHVTVLFVCCSFAYRRTDALLLFFLLVSEPGVGLAHLNVGQNPASQTLPRKHEYHNFSTRRTGRLS